MLHKTQEAKLQAVPWAFICRFTLKLNKPQQVATLLNENSGCNENSGLPFGGFALSLQLPPLSIRSLSQGTFSSKQTGIGVIANLCLVLILYQVMYLYVLSLIPHNKNGRSLLALSLLYNWLAQSTQPECCRVRSWTLQLYYPKSHLSVIPDPISV